MGANINGEFDEQNEPYEGIRSELKPLSNMLMMQVLIGGIFGIFSIYGNIRMGLPRG